MYTKGVQVKGDEWSFFVDESHFLLMGGLLMK
jgi:hypothetical protein